MVRAHDLLRLSRSLLDFAGLVDRFDRRTVSFVSVTQQFNTTSSLGSLTLNFLLSFAQFEREIIGERTRDIIDASAFTMSRSRKRTDAYRGVTHRAGTLGRRFSQYGTRDPVRP